MTFIQQSANANFAYDNLRGVSNLFTKSEEISSESDSPIDWISKISQKKLKEAHLISNKSLKELNVKKEKIIPKTPNKKLIDQIKHRIKNGSFSLRIPFPCHIDQLLQNVEQEIIQAPELQTFLIELAKREAKKGGQMTRNVLAYIQGFHINFQINEGQIALAEIAKLCAEKDLEVSPYLQNFNLNTNKLEVRKILKEIAIISSKNGYPVSPYIKNYRIDPITQEGRDLLIEIAIYDKAYKNPNYLILPHLSNYGLDCKTKDGEEALFCLAEIEINVLAYLIQQGIDFSIEEKQKKLANILYLHANQPYGLKIFANLKYLPINKEKLEEIWLEIAKRTSIQSPKQTINILLKNSFYLRSKRALLLQREILILASLTIGPKNAKQIAAKFAAAMQGLIKTNHILKDTYQSLFFLIPYLYLTRENEDILYVSWLSSINPSFIPFPKLLALIDHTNWSDHNTLDKLREEACKELEEKNSYPCLPIEEIKKLIKNETWYNLKTVALWAISTASLLPVKESKTLELKEILKDLINLPDPSLRYDFSDLLIRHHAGQKLGEIIRIYRLLKKNSRSQEKNNEPTAAKIIRQNISFLALAFAIAAKEGLDLPFLSQMIQNVSKIKSESHTPLLKNGPKMAIFLRAIIALNSSFALSSEERKLLLLQMLDREANFTILKERWIRIATFVHSNQENVLKRLVYSDQFQDGLDDEYQRLIFKNVPKFVNPNKVKEFFKTFRESDLLLAYFNKLKKINVELPPLELDKAEKSQINFWKAINNDAIPNYRYCESKHLEKVFQYDVNLQKKWMEGQKKTLYDPKNHKPYVVINTDNFYDLLACGTEVQGSCLHIRGGFTKFKRALFNYLDDGKIRLIAVKEKEKGPIKSRAIIRIMNTTDGGKPALLLEKIYPENACPSWMREGILEMAKSTAKELNLPLLIYKKIIKNNAFENLITSPYSHFIYSLGTRGYPCDYVDSLAGETTDQAYWIGPQEESLHQVILEKRDKEAIFYLPEKQMNNSASKNSLLELAKENVGTFLYLLKRNVFDVQNEEEQKTLIELLYFHAKKKSNEAQLFESMQYISLKREKKEEIYLGLVKKIALHSPKKAIQILLNTQFLDKFLDLKNKKTALTWRQNLILAVLKGGIEVSHETWITFGKLMDKNIKKEIKNKDQQIDDDFNLKDIDVDKVNTDLTTLLILDNLRRHHLIMHKSQYKTYAQAFPHFPFPNFLKLLDSKEKDEQLKQKTWKELKAGSLNYPCLLTPATKNAINICNSVILKGLLNNISVVMCLSSIDKLSVLKNENLNELKNILDIFPINIPKLSNAFSNLLIYFHTNRKLEEFIENYCKIKGNISPSSSEPNSSFLAFVLAAIECGGEEITDMLPIVP